MKKSLLTSGGGLDKRSCQPRPFGDLLTEMLHSDSPLAIGYRAFIASTESGAEKGGQSDE